MRLDHVSYVTSRDQLASVVQRHGARLASTFVDGGIHPRFGTRNFTLPLQNCHYLEVVCPLDHPSTDGKAIAKIVKVEITGDESRIEEWLGSELREAVGSDVEVEWVSADVNDGDSGIVTVHVMTTNWYYVVGLTFQLNIKER
jgi:hypothetical protein